MIQPPSLRNFLQKPPHPRKLRVKNAEGEERVVIVGVSRSRWRDAEFSCRGAYYVEALTEDGETLRSWVSPEAHDDEPEPVAPTAAAAANPMGYITELARVIVDAGDKAALRHAEAYKTANEQQLALMKLIADRLSSLESAWHEMIVQRAADAEAAAVEAETAAAARSGDDGSLTALAQAVATQLATVGGGNGSRQ